MTATTIAITATNISSSSALYAKKAREASCKATVKGFEHNKANTTEMREYAQCIDTLYPGQMPDVQVVFTKIGIVFILICFFVGMVKGWKADRFEGAVLCGLMGAIASFLSMAAIFMLLTGILFLFTP